MTNDNMSEQHVDYTTLNEYLDQILPPEEQMRIESHLRACATCRQQLAELESLFSTLDQTPELALEVDLVEGVVKAISTPPQVAQGDTSNLSISWLLIVTQLVVSSTLLALVWPSIRRAASSNRLSDFAETLSSGGTKIWLQITTQWQQFSAIVQTLIDRGVSNVNSNTLTTTIWPDITLLWWLTMVIILAIICIAGNVWGLPGYDLKNGEGK